MNTDSDPQIVLEIKPFWNRLISSSSFFYYRRVNFSEDTTVSEWCLCKFVLLCCQSIITIMNG